MGKNENLVDWGFFFWWVWGVGGMSKFLSSGGRVPLSTVRKILAISTLHTHSKGHGFKPSAFLESHKSFVKLLQSSVTRQAYFRPILRLTIEHCPLLQKLRKALFWCKTLKKGMNGIGEIFGALFSWKGVLSGQYLPCLWLYWG